MTKFGLHKGPPTLSTIPPSPTSKPNNSNSLLPKNPPQPLRWSPAYLEIQAGKFTFLQILFQQILLEYLLYARHLRLYEQNRRGPYSHIVKFKYSFHVTWSISIWINKSAVSQDWCETDGSCSEAWLWSLTHDKLENAAACESSWELTGLHTLLLTIVFPFKNIHGSTLFFF